MEVTPDGNMTQQNWRHSFLLKKGTVVDKRDDHGGWTVNFSGLSAVVLLYQNQINYHKVTLPSRIETLL